MNIKNIKIKKLPKGDKLKLLFKLQKKLAKKYLEIEPNSKQFPVEIDTKEGQEILRQKIMWGMMELAEISNCLKNKPWVQTEITVDKTHFLEEIADFLHFFLEFLIYAGVTPEELFEVYYKKNRVNWWRIKSKY